MRIVSWLALAVAMAGASVPAEAQRYFMRERIIGLPKKAAAATTNPSTTPTTTPATTPTSPTTPTVSYSWSTGSWSTGCGNSVTQYRSVTCYGSNGQSAADANCSNAGSKPATQQTGQNFDGCSYSVHDHGAGACSNGTRPHYYDCLRSDGTDGIFISTCQPGWNNPMMESC